MKHGFAAVISLGMMSGLLAAQSGSGLDGDGVRLIRPTGPAGALPAGAYGAWDPGWGRSAAGQVPRWDPPLFPNARSGLFFPDSYNHIYQEVHAQPIWALVAAAPPAVVVTPELPQKPPLPPRSQVHEYTWPRSWNNAPTLSVVLKNGSIRLALAMCIQDTKLTYITRDGVGEQVALEMVDLEATRKANAGRNPT